MPAIGVLLAGRSAGMDPAAGLARAGRSRRVHARRGPRRAGSGRTLAPATVLLLLTAFVIAAAIVLRLVWIGLSRAGKRVNRFNKVTLGETLAVQQTHDAIEACEASLVGKVGHMISVTDVRSRRHGWALHLLMRFIMFLGESWFTEARLGNAEGIKFGHWNVIDGGPAARLLQQLRRRIRRLPRRVHPRRLRRHQPHLAMDRTARPPTRRGRASPGSPARGVSRRRGCSRSAAASTSRWFKAYARDSMVPHLFRYEAYNHSNQDITRATRLRDALAAPSPDVVQDDRIMRGPPNHEPEPLNLFRPDLQAHAADIQAILASGFTPFRHVVYRLLQVTDGGKARQVAARRAERRFRQIGEGRRSGRRRSSTVRTNTTSFAMLAFSHAGLEAFGLAASGDFLVPHAVRARWAARSCPAPGEWPPVGEAHVLLAHYQDREGAGDARMRPDEGLHGLRVRAEIASCPSYITPGPAGPHLQEPFGFQDGIAQPYIDGLRRSPRIAPHPDDVLAPGEFILGHRNEYGELAYCPDVARWSGGPGRRFAMNGSYLAVQQIVQHVQRFRDFEAAQSPPGKDQPTLAEKMVGRRKDGKAIRN